jgi:hypothetical protein
VLRFVRLNDTQSLDFLDVRELLGASYGIVGLFKVKQWVTVGECVGSVVGIVGDIEGDQTTQSAPEP